MNFTEEQYLALKNRDTRKIVPGSPCQREMQKNIPLGTAKNIAIPFTNPKPNPRGRHKRGEMNKSETAFSMHLDVQKLAGLVKDWKFESVTLLLADDCRYTPDFNVEMANGDLVMVDVKKVWKGKKRPHWEDDALVKFKVAAKEFRAWFQFYGVHFDGSQWIYEAF